MGGKGRSKDGDGRGVGFVCFVDDNCFAVLRAVLLRFAGFAAVLVIFYYYDFVCRNAHSCRPAFSQPQAKPTA